MSVRILIGDARERLKELPDGSVDSCVCDPPYHLTNRTVDVKGCKDCGRTLGGRDGKPDKCPRCGGELHNQRSQGGKGFMGQQWDGGDVAFRPETWAEVLRVLKPGAHLVAFSGTRTYHRMACAIEDAGFEIRDQLAWCYGSGFPKSHDVAKQIDKAAGAERKVIGPNRFAALNGKANANVYGEASRSDETAPATDEARQWQGWGTALKPAWEPICLARKPLVGTVAANVLQHGTGALNIDGCRIEAGAGDYDHPGNDLEHKRRGAKDWRMPDQQAKPHDLGRWPANIIHDGSEEVLAGFPETGPGTTGVRDPNGTMGYHGGAAGLPGVVSGHADNGGSAARFFYCAKATTEERGEGNNHPTVKPIDLMRWLCRLVTPAGGTVLDPFAGSGSTLIAADAEQFNAIGCELSPDYAAIAERRVRDAAGMFAEVQAA